MLESDLDRVMRRPQAADVVPLLTVVRSNRRVLQSCRETLHVLAAAVVRSRLATPPEEVSAWIQEVDEVLASRPTAVTMSAGRIPAEMTSGGVEAVPALVTELRRQRRALQSCRSDIEWLCGRLEECGGRWDQRRVDLCVRAIDACLDSPRRSSAPRRAPVTAARAIG